MNFGLVGRCHVICRIGSVKMICAGAKYVSGCPPLFVRQSVHVEIYEQARSLPCLWLYSWTLLFIGCPPRSIPACGITAYRKFYHRKNYLFAVQASISLQARNWILAGLAAFLVLVHWSAYSRLGADGTIMADGIGSSAVVVLMISVGLSLASWATLSCIAKNITLQGIALGIIVGASLVMPFLQVLGPMSGVIVGIVAGFAAFLFQRRISSHRGRPLRAVTVTLGSAYFVLIVIALMLPVMASIWNAGDGISTWSGTPEGLETPGFNDSLHDRIDLVFLVISISSLAVTGLVVRR